MAVPTRRFHVPSAVRRSPLRLEVDAVRELMAAGALLIDVRRHDDRTPALEGSSRIWPDELPGRLADFRRDLPIVLACT